MPASIRTDPIALPTPINDNETTFLEYNHDWDAFSLLTTPIDQDFDIINADYLMGHGDFSPLPVVSPGHMSDGDSVAAFDRPLGDMFKEVAVSKKRPWDASFDDQSDSKAPHTKRRKLEPKQYIKDGLKTTDVRMGRGGASNKHAGNKKFRKLAASQVESYIAATKNIQKSAIGKKLVNTMRRKHKTRFLAFCEDQQQWYLASELRVQEKGMQALREAVLRFKKLQVPHVTA